MMRLIDADELLKPVGSYDRVKYTYEYGDVVTVEDIELMPTIEAVSVGTLEQFIWERNLAIGQLNEIGKDLGSKMDNVITVVKCKDCILDKEAQCPMKYATEPDDYCSFGERIDGEKT